MSKVVIVGAGINGITAAIELKKRGHDVVLVDPGPLPHPLAASTDISKAVRAAYGADEDYTALADRSIALWREWNREFGIQLYHEVGVMFLRHRTMQPGDFEYESLKLFERRGRSLRTARFDEFARTFSGVEFARFIPMGFWKRKPATRKRPGCCGHLSSKPISLGVELRSASSIRGVRRRH